MKSFISYQQALEDLIEISNELKSKHFISSQKALGFVCAEDVICRKNLPSFNNAAMDGFAFKFSEKDDTLAIKETILAGKMPKESLHVKQCYKIMTGAFIPDDADTIVEIERVVFEDEKHIKLPKDIKKYNAFRFKAEEQKVGNILIEKNTILTPSHIMLLASQGIVSVCVYVKPKIAVISTGDEIKEPWEKIDENSIYNANTSGIIAILNRYGFDADYVGVAPDNVEKLSNFFGQLKQNYNVIISSGGVSMGEADFVLQTLKKNGFEEKFHGVKIKPGRPMLAGKLQNTLVISLPGNPMACFLTTYLFVVVAVKKMSNYKNPYHEMIKAKNFRNFCFKNGRTNIILGNYKDNIFEVTEDNRFGSGMITPLAKSNCLALSDEVRSDFKKNENIDIILF